MRGWRLPNHLLIQTRFFWFNFLALQSIITNRPSCGTMPVSIIFFCLHLLLHEIASERSLKVVPRYPWRDNLNDIHKCVMCHYFHLVDIACLRLERWISTKFLLSCVMQANFKTGQVFKTPLVRARLYSTCSMTGQAYGIRKTPVSQIAALFCCALWKQRISFKHNLCAKQSSCSGASI